MQLCTSYTHHAVLNVFDNHLTREKVHTELRKHGNMGNKFLEVFRQGHNTQESV